MDELCGIWIISEQSCYLKKKKSTWIPQEVQRTAVSRESQGWFLGKISAWEKQPMCTALISVPRASLLYPLPQMESTALSNKEASNPGVSQVLISHSHRLPVQHFSLLPASAERNSGKSAPAAGSGRRRLPWGRGQSTRRRRAPAVQRTATVWIRNFVWPPPLISLNLQMSKVRLCGASYIQDHPTIALWSWYLNPRLSDS